MPTTTYLFDGSEGDAQASGTIVPGQTEAQPPTENPTDAPLAPAPAAPAEEAADPTTSTTLPADVQQQGESDEDHIARIAEKYRNDPKVLSQKILEMQRGHARATQELGELRKFRQQYEGRGITPQEPEAEETPSEADLLLQGKVELPEVPKPETSPDLPEEVAPFEFNKDAFDPSVDAVDPEWGLPVGVDGKPYIPKDAFGLPFYPETRFAVVEQTLRDENPTAAESWIQQQMMEIRAVAARDHANRFAELEQNVWKTHQLPAARELRRVQGNLEYVIPKEVAAEVTKELEGIARETLPQRFRSREISAPQYFAPNALAAEVQRLWAQVDLGKLREDVAKKQGQQTATVTPSPSRAAEVATSTPQPGTIVPAVPQQVPDDEKKYYAPAGEYTFD